MSQFKFFYKDWLDVDPFLKLETKHDNGFVKICHLPVNLTSDFFYNLKFDDDSLKQYRIDAALKCAETLGEKPALCLSGGIDSQAAWQCFNDAGIDIDVYTLVFKNGLNSQDVDHAIHFAKERNFKLNLIEIDILNFLSRENSEYSIKYKSLSPHFNTHYKLCNMLIAKGYTGFVCGGGVPMIPDFNDEYDGSSYMCFNYTQNFMNYVNYSVASNRLCQGNFLSFYPELAWATSILTPIELDPLYHKSRSTLSQGGFISQQDRDKIEYMRYLYKIEGYNKAGFNVIPQEKKFTGFELVKKELEKKYNDGWMFEKLYRTPLQQHVQEVGLFYDFDDNVLKLITNLNAEKSGPSLNPSSGIGV